MPRETITTVDGDSVNVGWFRDQECVQVYSTWLEPDPTPNSHGVVVELKERGQVNDLIRHLRKARDQAFGRDE